MNRNSAVTILLSLAFIISGCATLDSVTTKNENKFETTQLFVKVCKERTELEKSDKNKNEGIGFFEKFKSSKEKRTKEVNTAPNCNEVDLTAMIMAFGNIKESDGEAGVIGDSIEDVKKKGFTIHIDSEEKIRRPSTEILYGADALAAVGIPVNPPQLDTPESIETYKKYMKSHFAWTFKETNLEGTADRIYINTKNGSTTGPDYKFVITFKDNRVFRRVIKGGHQNTVTRESAFLLGPGGFISDLLIGGVNRGVGLIK